MRRFLFAVRLRPLGLALLAVAILMVPARPVAQPDPFRVARIALEASGDLRLEFPSDPDSYFILFRGDDLARIDNPRSMLLGAEGTGTLMDTAPVSAAAFFRVQRVPNDQSLDTDGDGIPDVYELRRARFLDPLNGADGGLDFDNDGKSNREEFEDGTDPEQPDLVIAVELVRPAAGATFASPAEILLEADAAPEIVRMTFFADDAMIGESDQRPYRLTWEGVAAGLYRVRASGIDGDGNVFRSEVRSIAVNIGAPGFSVMRAATREAVFLATGQSDPGSTVRVVGGTRTVTGVSDDAGVFSVPVPLHSNRINRLFGVAADEQGRTSSQSALQVIQDNQAPELFIDFPADNARIVTETTVVTGRVGDALSGFMGLGVTVNGEAANVIIGIGPNGTFERAGVPLTLGLNILSVTATDALGNTLKREIAVERVEPVGHLLSPVSGDGQKGVVGQLLPDPVVVSVRTAQGEPVPNKLVTFEITRSDGGLFPVDDAGSAGVRRLQIKTDAGGRAAARWSLGADAGCGNNRLRVGTLGVMANAFFCASSDPGAASQINIGSGNNQRAESGGPAPEPLRVWVNDSCNGVAGVRVQFAVIQGGGTIGGENAVTVETGPTGHAEVQFTLGAEEGNNLIEASIEGLDSVPARFNIVGLSRNPDQSTTFSGLVLNNSNQPIGGARCALEIDGQIQWEAFSDPGGRFEFANVAHGVGHLRVDGLTASTLGGMAIDPGSFPGLAFEVLIVPNAANSLPTPILLPALNPANVRTYDGTRDVELTVEGMAGLRMRVTAGSMTRADGTRPSPEDPAILSLNQVHYDEVPMPMPDGAAPPFAWTLQPAGAHFDPPIQIRYPNMSGLKPGSIAYFLSFDHATERFEIVATGHVESDGACIVTDRGTGLKVAGWGCNCPPYAATGDCEGTRTRTVVRDPKKEDDGDGTRERPKLVTTPRDPPDRPGSCIAYCVQSGRLNPPTVERRSRFICPDETIVFAAPPVSDSGGLKELACRESDGSVSLTPLPVPPVPVEYRWTISGPGNLSQSGGGPTASVVARMPGEYVCRFTAFARRDCPPEPLPLPPETVTAIALDLAMQGLAEENDGATNTPHETDPGAVIVINDNDDDDLEGVDKDAGELPLTSADPDVKPFQLAINPNPGEGTVTLTPAPGTRVWKDAMKNETPLVWDLASESLPSTLFVEGLAVGMGDMRLVYSGEGQCEDAVKITVIDVWFVDASDEEVEVATDFSHPAPIVTLDPVRKDDLRVANNMAQVRIRGAVTDMLADMVEGGAADIPRVFVEFSIDGDSGGITRANLPAGDRSEFVATVPVDVVRMDNQGPTSLRPFPFEGRFDSEIIVPLWVGDMEVTVRADNLIGESGYDSFSIRVGDRFDQVTAANVSTLGLEPEIQADQIQIVRNHEETRRALENPIRIFIDDPSVTRENLDDFKVRFMGADFNLRFDGDQLQADRPFATVAEDFSGNIPNLNHVFRGESPSMLNYRGIERELDWTYTTQETFEGYTPDDDVSPVAGLSSIPAGAPSRLSEAKYLEFASGTTMSHTVRGKVFNRLSVKNNDVGKLSVQRLLDRGDFKVWEISDPNIQLLSVAPVPAIPALGLERGYRVTMRLGSRSRENPRGVNTGIKKIRFKLEDNGGREFEVSIGHFKVILLKTIIVGVDGLAYDSIRGILDAPVNQTQARFFRGIFRGSPSKDSVALAALPSITFCNWSGIFSGEPPGRHGIMGNSFFERERAPNREPFASSGKTPTLDFENASVALFGALNKLARSDAGSLYDRLNAPLPEVVDAWSVHFFYSRATPGRANMNREHYGLSLKYHGHDPDAARNLDVSSGYYGRLRFEANRDQLNVLSVYFPGPDNIAHAVGDRIPSPHPPFNSGPILPEVGDPLVAIREQMEAITDTAFSGIVRSVVRSGYFNATLFALVADHGLHAFQNVAGFNVVLPGPLEQLFENAGIKVWRDELFEDIDDQNLVYAANGGLAHIYIRSGQRRWDQPASRTSIEQAARLLFNSAVTPNTVLGPRANRAYGARVDNGALGILPAIFVRVGGGEFENHFRRGYRWVAGVNQANGQITYDTVDAFHAVRNQLNRYVDPQTGQPNFNWPALAERLDELNDPQTTGTGASRSGDIVIFTDARGGYLTVNDGDNYNGWHGGATPSESRTPLMFSMGPFVDDAFKTRVITNAVSGARMGRTSRTLRNWDLSETLNSIYGQLEFIRVGD